MVVVSDSFSIVWLSKGSDSSPISAKKQKEAVSFFPHFSNPRTWFRVLRQMAPQWFSYHLMPLPRFEPSVELHQPGPFWGSLYQLSYRVLAKRGRILSHSQCKRSWLFEAFRLKMCSLRSKQFFSSQNRWRADFTQQVHLYAHLEKMDNFSYLNLIKCRNPPDQG